MVIKGYGYKLEKQALIELREKEKKRTPNKLWFPKGCMNAVTLKTLDQTDSLEWVVMQMFTTNLSFIHFCLTGNLNLAQEGLKVSFTLHVSKSCDLPAEQKPQGLENAKDYQ